MSESEHAAPIPPRPGPSGAGPSGAGPVGVEPSGTGPSGGAARTESEPPATAHGTPETPVAAALRELDTLADRELAEHPDVYQRIHAELQAALTTIDNA